MLSSYGKTIKGTNIPSYKMFDTKIKAKELVYINKQILCPQPSGFYHNQQQLTQIPE